MLAIIGPTASGKSHLAIHLAKRFGGEVINCDSLQMYRYFDIGSGKLSPPEQQGVGHHLMDVLDPAEQFSAGEYARRATNAISSLDSVGKLPIIVGGTGFYLRALIDGLFSGPSRNPALRERLQLRASKKGRTYLHKLLLRLDPEAAGRIHPHDAPKIIRAIEVSLETKHPISELFRQGRNAIEGHQIVKLGLNPTRTALYETINRRTLDMFETGLVEEVAGILAKGVLKTAPPFQALGYREAIAFLEGRTNLEQAVRLAQTRTRQYAKRQMTWFRKDSGVQWFSGFGTNNEIQEQASNFVLSQLPGLSARQLR